MARKRKSSGSMLVLVVLLLGIIVAVVVCGLTLNSFFFQHGRAQYQADATTVELARRINSSDRVGQMNELVEASRELVHVSRQHMEQSQQDSYELMAPLCAQLMDEARLGSSMVESERKHLARVVCKEVQDAAREYNAERDGWNVLAWLQTSQPRIARIDVGYMPTVQSNIRSFDAVQDLSVFDRKHGVVEARSNLLKANADLKLPGVDGDLDFRLASLPANVAGTCSPARNLNPESFKFLATIIQNGERLPINPEDIPSSLQIYFQMDTALGQENKNASTLYLQSTATTSGAIAGAK